MVKLVLACALLPATAPAAGFTLSIGPPVAAGTGSKVLKSKGASFAVRLEECDALDTAQISGMAEGIVDGARKSDSVTISAMGSPGVYVVSQAWEQALPNQGQGVWAVNVTATCGKAKAGAIVPMGPQGFLRDGTKILPRAATKAEIDSSLKAFDRPAK